MFSINIQIKVLVVNSFYLFTQKYYYFNNYVKFKAITSLKIVAVNNN